MAIAGASSRALYDAGKHYRADRFTLTLPDDWVDKTVFTFTGPVENGIQHNVIINVEPEAPFDKVVDYADAQVLALEEQLKGCRLLKNGAIKLHA